MEVTLKVETTRRRMIETHHTATHLMHWALHDVVGPEVAQQGSLVAMAQASSLLREEKIAWSL